MRYGYRKDPADKNHWLVDDEAAAVVRRIYQLAIDCHGPYEIARILEADKVECPAYYNATHNTCMKRSNTDMSKPYTWNGVMVSNILKRPEYYSLRSKRKETHDLTVELNARIDAYEKWKKYRKHYQAWEKLPEAKRTAFERSHEYELRQYRQAAAALRRWQADGEKIDHKGWKAALDYLNKEQFMLDYQLQEMKEKVRRMEIVKRELIQENKRTRSDRYVR